MSGNCGTCAAWLKTNGDQGECHFAPPQAVFMGFRPPALQGGQSQPMIAGVFPAVGADRGCRQWARALATMAVPVKLEVLQKAARNPHAIHKALDGVWKCHNCNSTGDMLETTECKNAD